MAGIFEVCVGWILGIGSSYIFRIYDRTERKNNFINGVETELLELLPRLVSNIYVMKNSIGQLNHEVLKWVDLVCSKMQLEVFPGNDICIKTLLNYPSDDLLEASKFMAAQKAGTRLSLKKFHIDYIERNIDILPLMDNNIQRSIIDIISRLKLVNQEIDLYQFYFEKTFDPKSCSINEKALNTNLDNSTNLLSKELIKISDSITNLLSQIRAAKCIESYYKFKNILVKIDEFIKNRRL